MGKQVRITGMLEWEEVREMGNLLRARPRKKIKGGGKASEEGVIVKER